MCLLTRINSILRSTTPVQSVPCLPLTTTAHCAHKIIMYNVLERLFLEFSCCKLEKVVRNNDHSHHETSALYNGGIQEYSQENYSRIKTASTLYVTFRENARSLLIL